MGMVIVMFSSLNVPRILFLSFLILCFVYSCTSCLDLSYGDKSRWLKKMVEVGWDGGKRVKHMLPSAKETPMSTTMSVTFTLLG